MTKKKAKGSASKKPAAAKAAAVVPIEKLENELEKATAPYWGWESQLEEAETEVKVKEAELADAKARLERIAEPARRILALANSPELRQMLEAQPYDDALRETFARIKKVHGGWGKDKNKKTGAIAWSELKRTGATDAQILLNARYSEDSHQPGGEMRYTASGRPSDPVFNRYNARGADTAILKRPKLIDELRRVFEIPQPIAGAAPAAAAAAKPAGNKSGNKKPTKSKRPAAKPKAAASGTKPAKGGTIGAARETPAPVHETNGTPAAVQEQLAGEGSTTPAAIASHETRPTRPPLAPKHEEVKAPAGILGAALKKPKAKKKRKRSPALAAAGA